jgi:hypothetical protein
MVLAKPGNDGRDGVWVVEAELDGAQLPIASLESLERREMDDGAPVLEQTCGAVDPDHVKGLFLDEDGIAHALASAGGEG